MKRLNPKAWLDDGPDEPAPRLTKSGRPRRKTGPRPWDGDDVVPRLMPLREVARRMGVSDRTCWTLWTRAIRKVMASPRAREVVADLVSVGELARRAALAGLEDYRARDGRPVALASSGLLVASSAECRPWVRELWGNENVVEED